MAQTPGEQPNKQDSNNPSPKSIGCTLAVLVALVIGGIMWLFGGGDDSQADSKSHKSSTEQTTSATNKPGSRDRKIEAVTMCESLVKDRLYSPSSASFQSAFNLDVKEQVEYYKKDNLYSVSSEVDAENKFGSKQHRHYTCETKPDKNYNHWKLVTLTGPAFADIGQTTT